MIIEVVGESNVRVVASSGKADTTKGWDEARAVKWVSRLIRERLWDNQGETRSELVMNEASSRMIRALRWLIWPTEGHEYDDTTRMEMPRER
jgi:hypothetical protein